MTFDVTKVQNDFILKYIFLIIVPPSLLQFLTNAWEIIPINVYVISNLLKLIGRFFAAMFNHYD